MVAKKILIDARMLDGQAGGIQQVVCGIAQGLSQLDTTSFEIGFCVYEGEFEWLRPYLSERFCRIEVPKGGGVTGRRGLSSALKGFVRERFGHLLGSISIHLASEPQAVRNFNPDLIHFVHQNCFETERPYLFTPHDLQHEYYPEYFDRRTLMVRRHLYRRHAECSSAAVCISEACQRDVGYYLGVEIERCPVIYNAPLNGRSGISKREREEVTQKYDLPDQFLYYPAKTYPHKNHRRLVEALHQLKRGGLEVPLVCSGPLTLYYDEILRPLVGELGMEKQVRFLGWLSEKEVSVLYDSATALIFPSEFEGFGLPLIEAMRSGLPVCCSDSSCIPEIVEDAAVCFSAHKVENMAVAIREVWEGKGLRQSLVVKGRRRAADFSWEISSQQYLDLYESLLLKSK